MKNNKKGFTIVELVIVIAVIAILAAVLIPTFSNVIDKSNRSAVMQAGRAKFEEIYAVDMADGAVDDKDTTSADHKTDIDLTKLDGMTGCTYEVDATGKVKFTYSDASKKLKASYDGSNWTVDKYTPA